ncbi:MAG: CopG family transcriptional regulator [Christensenellaceae bacterium]|nr:CopG family transcriptional regulator [Christensenellaceae bacterium]
MKKVAVIGIVLTKNGGDEARKVQDILSQFADIIIGRMGIPSKEYGVNIISVAVAGENEKISALSGALGRLEGVAVKSAITSVEVK